NGVRRNPAVVVVARVAVGVFEVVTAKYILTRPRGCARKYYSQSPRRAGRRRAHGPGEIARVGLADRDDPQRPGPHQVAHRLMGPEQDPPAGLVEPRGAELRLDRDGGGGDKTDASSAALDGGGRQGALRHRGLPREQIES